MGFISITLPVSLAVATILAAIADVFRNARLAPWTRLKAPGAFSAWCFTIVVLPLLWRLKIPVMEGASLHLLGMPIFVLMFGRQLAMVGLSISVFAYTAAFDGTWANIGMNVLLLAVVPAYCGDAVMRATKRYLPHHIFVYLLGNGLFGALVITTLIGTLSLGVHLAFAVGSPVIGDTVAYMLLLAWGESLLTGFLLTIFTVYRPEWVLTFDDDVYLRGK